MERLVRVEALDLQEPPLGPVVALQKLERGLEALRAREVSLVLDELAIYRVLPRGSRRIERLWPEQHWALWMPRSRSGPSPPDSGRRRMGWARVAPHPSFPVALP
jgi:hypothetical protein